MAFEKVENTFPDVNEIDRNYGKVENHIFNVSVGKCAEELYDIDANNFNPNFDPEKSDYEIFMDECNLNGSMTKYCDCAYNKYIEYGIDYYMNNIDRVVEDCKLNHPFCDLNIFVKLIHDVKEEYH